MKVHLAGAVFRCSSLLILLVIRAVRLTPQTSPPNQASDKLILIKNAEVFDGVSHELHRSNVLIVRTKIQQISSAPIPPPPQATVIVTRADECSCQASQMRTGT